MEKTLPKLYYRIRILRIYCFLAVLLLSGSIARGQGLTVSGQVVENGNALPGVSILEKGTTTGTTSDAEGKFTLNVSSSSSVLLFSFIGYKTQEVAVNNQTSFTITMEEDATALSEVIVTALGVQKDVKALGYAVQKVEGKSMTKAREPNIINSLTGKVAGLEIKNQTDLFQDPGIRLRGAKPLMVIDGVPNIEGDLWKVNADDIESFSVLKGATASALYGSIGRNGAIMITTKRGSKGGLTVEVNSSTMFQPSFIRIPDVQSTYGNGNNGQYAYVDGSAGGTEGGGWIWGPKLDQPDPSTPSGFWETPQFNSPVDPNTGNLIPLPFLSRGANNVKNFFRTGVISTNNVSVTGGNESSNFRISVSNLYQRGIVPNSQLNNTSMALSGGMRLGKNLKADASLTYNRQYTDNFPETGYGSNNYLYNLILWTGPDVDVRDQRNYWVKGKEGTQQRNYNTSWYNNPYFQAYEFLRGYYKDNVFGQVNLVYTVLPGLDLSLRTGMNQYGLNRTYKEPKSYIAYDNISHGNYTITNETQLSLNTDFIASYTKELNENFSLRVSAGGANRWRTYRYSSIATDGLRTTGQFNLSNSENKLRGSNQEEEEKVNSLYGTIDLDILGGIFLGVTLRQDWVSTLPIKNNTFFYPGLSLAGVVTDFVDLNSYKISFLKLRTSWSRVSEGKVKIPGNIYGEQYPYQHIPAYEAGVNWNGSQSVFFSENIIDPNLKTETSDSFEAGFDIRFLNGRVGLDGAFYTIKDYNNLIQVPLSGTSGYRYKIQNAGQYERKGIELTLSGSPVKGNVFTWDVIVNWSKYHKYLRSSDIATLYVKEGDRTDEINGFSYLHTPGGQLVLGSNGYPLNDPFNRLLGYSDPDYIFGIQNTFGYKNFTLGISLDGRVGGVMWSRTNQKMWWGGSHPGTVNQYRDDANSGLATYVAPGVTIVEGDVQYGTDGTILNDTRVYAPNTTAVNYISWNVDTSNALLNHYYNQTFMKLREITITYNIPSSILSKVGMKKAAVSLVGRNLILWSDMPEVDPDSGSDELQTPSTRNVGFNLNFTF